jgi:abhydrolase domain-containing protein 17
MRQEDEAIRRTLRMLLIFVFTLYAGFGLLMWLIADRVLFQPPSPNYTAQQAQFFTAADGTRIAYVHIIHPAARYTVLFTHGNAEDLGSNAEFFRMLGQEGLSVFSWDYRGYGASDGRANEANVYADAEAAYAHLTEKLGVPADRIIVHGRSLGGAPALHISANRPVAGLVLESPFTTAFRVLTRVPLYPFDRFRNLDRIPQVRCPSLVIHGDRDRVIPFAHGQQVYRLLPEPKRALWVEGADHNDLIYLAGDKYNTALREFAVWVEQLESTTAASAPRQ